MAQQHFAALDIDTLTPSQQERRERILEAAQELAAKGGYDAVQMREVSERADVALGTLYRYFPSKVHLLVATMNGQTEALQSRMLRRPPTGETAEERVLDVLRRATRGLEREPQLTGAMLRALMFAGTSAARDVDSVNNKTKELILRAMLGSTEVEPTATDWAIARVISQVWQSSLLTWLTGRLSSTELYESIEVAVHLLLEGRRD